MFAIHADAPVDLEALARLRARCAFTAQPASYLADQIGGARWTVQARIGDELVGFARAISDGVSNAYLSSVMVDPDHRRRGIGRALIEHLLRDRAGIKFTLHTRPEAAAFYAALGFTPATDILIRDRI